MATQTLTIASETCIPSCRPAETEIQQGEEVILELKNKNPLWSSNLKATVALIANTTSGRTYHFDYDDADLQGGPLIEECDVSEIRCYSCCDAINERLDAFISALPVTENEDGTFTWNG